MEPVVAPVENVVASVETGVAPMGIVVAAPVLDELEGCGVLDVGSLRMKGVGEILVITSGIDAVAVSSR